jgi:choline dehydrogenase-like flavoprotein
MLIDVRKVDKNSTLQADICIIGAGAAGIAITRELMNRNSKIILLESGGFEPDQQTQSMYAGETIGSTFSLITSRIRFFGGSTNEWRGNCRPMDEIDFKKRSYVPFSGWPIERKDLLFYYQRAQQVCELLDFEYYNPEKLSNLKDPPLALDRSKMISRVVQTGRSLRFGQIYRDEIVAAKDVDACIYANVVEIEVKESGSLVNRVKVATLTGNEFHVSARKFILATGGIENCRLMLNSNTVCKRGVGNDHDVVGRYFTGHPSVVLPFQSNNGSQNTKFYNFYGRQKIEGAGIWGNFSLSETMMDENHLLNACVYLEGLPPNGILAYRRIKTRLNGESNANLAGDIGRVMIGLPAITRYVLMKKVFGKVTGEKFIARTMFEQTPDPENRVVLSTERGPLNQLRANLHLRLSNSDRENYIQSLQLMAKELNISGFEQPLRSFEKRTKYFSHHIGGTRMSSDPKLGVVDKDCKVHGVSNLFIAGSSVFPTSGSAAPTLTLIALALRLADHIKSLPPSD